MAIYQDLVDSQGFVGAYNSVKRFAGSLCRQEPEQFDRLAFAPGEECQSITARGRSPVLLARLVIASHAFL
jgi:hypothetical protein